MGETFIPLLALLIVWTIMGFGLLRIYIVKRREENDG